MGFLTKKQEKIISNFIEFTCEELGIEKIPAVCVQDNRKGIKTTALYDYSGEKKIVRVYGKNRAIVDVLRSIAHELVHHKQFEDGRLKIKPKDIGGEIEDEANAKAGQFIKLYSKIDPTIYDEEDELLEQETQDTGGTTYPEVGKWESGVARGPANQIGNTKWSEVVGGTLNRGKANKLK